MKIRKSDFCVLLLVAFPIFNVFGDTFSYYDEIVGVMSIAYICILALKKRLGKTDNIIFGLLCMLTVLGIISNIFSKLTSNMFAIIVDILWFWKMFSCYIFFEKVTANKDVRERVIRNLANLAKMVIVFSGFCAILGQVIDLGFVDNSGATYIGLKPFGFFGNNGIQTGWLIFGCILVLSVSNIQPYKLYKYLLVATIPLVLTFSSLVYCWLCVEIMLLIIIKANSRFKMWYMLLLGGVVALFTFADIYKYILSDSVRMTFLRYGAITANHYFPFGSGFATYGSEMAARYYSELYVSYGWENTWALGRTGRYLNDNFIASIIGQLGWIGFLIYTYILYLLLVTFNTKKLSKLPRVTSIATIITICIVMIGSASVKSAMGCFIFSLLGVVSSCQKNEYEELLFMEDAL